MRILAKSQPAQDLPDHLKCVRDRALTLLTPARRSAFIRLGIGESEAEDLLLSAAWLHDFGKATEEWQAKIISSDTPPQHSLTSFLACLWALGVRSVGTMPPAHLALSLAVLGHHGQLASTSFMRSNYQHEFMSLFDGVWPQLVRSLPIKAAELQPLRQQVKAVTVCDRVHHAKARVPELACAGPFRGLFCLLLTLLIQADQSASGNAWPALPGVGAPNIPGHATSFQTAVETRPEAILCAMAGCGSGKTAAALLRAAEMTSSNRVDRVVLCLPTRFTSNSLLRDMCDAAKYAYPGDQVGLVHSEALPVLKSVFDAGDETDFPEDPNERFYKSVRYEHSITISTVDHLLMSLYHGYKFSDRAFGNLMSSLVVFDEVHAYDNTTLNAIREGQEVLKQHGVPCLFMSATLPASRRQFFGLWDNGTVCESGNPFRPFVVRKLDAPLTSGKPADLQVVDVTRRLLRDAQDLKLAIYVNQVERAKALARAAREELPGTRIFCYHSELAPRDRLRMEENVILAFAADEPVVLVATQAAELSLDISAERMITELAPVDVLVQRAGRLNRRGLCAVLQGGTRRLAPGFAFILQIAPLDLEASADDPDFVPAAALPYKDVALLRKTWDTAPWDMVLTFELGMKWCEQVLTDAPPVINVGVERAASADAAFGNRPQDNFAGEGNANAVSIRDIDEDTVLVVPELYRNRLGDDHRQIAQFQVPIRRTKFYGRIDAGFVEETRIPIVLRRTTRRQIVVDYPVKIIRSNIPYSPEGGGFDLSPKTGEVLPTLDLSDSFA